MHVICKDKDQTTHFSYRNINFGMIHTLQTFARTSCQVLSMRHAVRLCLIRKLLIRHVLCGPFII